MNKNANILIGCEESQIVTSAFRELGFYNTFSCDLQPTSGIHPEWHLQMDVFEALELKDWDMGIFHPDCTKVAISGNATYAEGMPKHHERIASAKWTEELWVRATKKCKKVCFENPVGTLNRYTILPKPQYVQPYWFGDAETKKTGLFLHGLPPLKKTNEVKPVFATMKNGEVFRDSKGFRDSPTHYSTLMIKDNFERRKARSKTFPGFAKAMATQWSEFILSNP